jgi:hypothetical protein
MKTKIRILVGIILGWGVVEAQTTTIETKAQLNKEKIVLHRMANSGVLDGPTLRAFLTYYWKDQTDYKIKKDENGDPVPGAFQEAVKAHDLEVAGEVDNDYINLTESNTSYGRYFRKNGHLSEYSVADLLLKDPGYSPSAIPLPTPTPPPSNDGSTTPEVYYSLRKTSGLLDSNFSVQPDKTSGKSSLASSPSESGALLSYNRNFATTQDTWTAQGSAGLPIRFFPNSDDLSGLWFVPSVDFNYLGGSGVAAKSKLDSLQFNLGTLFNFGLGDRRTLDLRVAAVNATDFEFSSLLTGGEVEFEYKDPGHYIGSDLPLIWNRDDKAYLSVLSRFTLRMDGGSVLAPGGQPSLVLGQDYSRIGPIASFTFSAGSAVSSDIKGCFPITTVTYGHLAGLMGRAYDDININAKWNLLSDGSIAFSILYDHGDLNADQATVDQLTIGFTLKH